MAGKTECPIISRILNSMQARQEFQAKNFVKALEFTNKIGAIAKDENHHPLIVVERERVTVQ